MPAPRHECQRVRAAGAAAWPGPERQAAGEPDPHHLAGVDSDVTDGGGHKRLPLDRGDRRVIAQCD
jgi:hypothetical protein